MQTTFFSRFLYFSLAFYAGSVATIFVLTIVKTTVFFQDHFWSWLISWMKWDVFPIILAELLRSPIMGLLFAVVGIRWIDRNTTIKFGIVCGTFSYAIAYFFSILGSTGGTLAQSVNNLNLIEYSLLGLPLALVLLSHFWVTRRV